MKHILCFGDSNTWGYIPASGARYDEHVRWTGVLADALGASFRVHEDGLNARTSVFDSPFKPFLNGMPALQTALWAQKPLDALVLSLGTNDLKTWDAARSAAGVGTLVAMAQSMDSLYPSSTPVFRDRKRILVISPILVGDWLSRIDPDSDLAGAAEASRAFPRHFATMCASLGVEMLDAQTIAAPSGEDAVHMTPEGHRALGLAVADWVRRAL